MPGWDYFLVSQTVILLNLHISNQSFFVMMLYLCILLRLQVNIPMGMHEGLPISISLVAGYGADGFLLTVVERLYDLLKQDIMLSSL